MNGHLKGLKMGIGSPFLNDTYFKRLSQRKTMVEFTGLVFTCQPYIQMIACQNYTTS